MPFMLLRYGCKQNLTQITKKKDIKLTCDDYRLLKFYDAHRN